LIVPAADDTALEHYDRPDRHLPLINSPLGLGQGLPHEVFVAFWS